MVSLKKKVYNYLNLKPKTTIRGVYNAFPDCSRNTLRNYYHMWKGGARDSDQVLEQLRWIYNLMCEKIIKGIKPNKKERDRLMAIEKILELR